MIENSLPFIVYIISLGIAAVIPGPGVAAVIGRALGAGASSSLPFILGLAFGDVIFLTIAVLGLATLAAAASSLFMAVKIAGGLYLLYLAWRFWTDKVERTEIARPPSRNGWIVAASGLAVTLGNPKTVVFYLALLPNVLDLTVVDLLDWIILSALTMGVLVVVLMPYALLAAHLRSVLTHPTALRRLNRSAALMIGGAGLIILRDTVRKV